MPIKSSYVWVAIMGAKMVILFAFQIPSCTTYSRSDQSPGLGAHCHAQRAASDQDLPGETLLTERGHAGKNTPLQPSVGTVRWGSYTLHVDRPRFIYIHTSKCSLTMRYLSASRTFLKLKAFSLSVCGGRWKHIGSLSDLRGAYVRNIVRTDIHLESTWRSSRVVAK